LLQLLAWIAAAAEAGFDDRKHSLSARWGGIASFLIHTRDVAQQQDLEILN
jgi:hypothetical protein